MKEARIADQGGRKVAFMTSAEWDMTDPKERRVRGGEKQVRVWSKRDRKNTYYPVVIKDSLEALVGARLSERQKAEPTMHQDTPNSPAREVSPRQGSFKVGTADLNLIRKELGNPENILFKKGRDYVNSQDRDLIAKVWSEDPIVGSIGSIRPDDPDIIKAQEVIARRPRESFKIWLRRVGQYFPRLGAAIRKRGDEATVPLYFYMMVMRVSGRDAAEFILQGYLSTDQYFKKFRSKKESMQESGTGGGCEGADISDFEKRCKCQSCGFSMPGKMGVPCRKTLCPECGSQLSLESVRTTALKNMDKAAGKMAANARRPGDVGLEKKFRSRMLAVKKKKSDGKHKYR